MNSVSVQKFVKATEGVPTIRDVARVAEVSHQTVSRVINGAATVAPATRGRVLEAIARTGWQRDEQAAAMARMRPRNRPDSAL